jgi:hypothetical protein
MVEHQLQHLADSVRPVVSELVTYALVHAGTAFRVTLSADDRAVVLSVRDDSDSLPAHRTAQVLDPSGRGLDMVVMVSADWGVNTDEVGFKAVWASFIG